MNTTNTYTTLLPVPLHLPLCKHTERDAVMEKVHAPDVATYVYNLTLCSAHDGTYEDWKNNEYVQF
jgi:hypothetical protein